MLEEDDADFHPFLMISEGESGQHESNSSLGDWNHKDPSRLMHLIHEIRDLYMSYQQTRVEELDDARLKFELSTVPAKEVMEAIASVSARRHFIEVLAPLFGRPVEADPIFCRRATVFAASGVFTFLVHFFRSNQFPKHQPALILQSSQHFDSKLAPVRSASLSDYPWSPRWSSQEMAERIFDFLAEECLNFKEFDAERTNSRKLHHR